MATVYMVQVPQARRVDAERALLVMGCFIEEQGFMEGSTTWGFVVACFERKLAHDTYAFDNALRERMAGEEESRRGGGPYKHWLRVSVYRDESVRSERNIKRGDKRGEQND